MTAQRLNSDSLVLLLLCSDLAMSNFSVKPYTLKQWESLSKKLLMSNLKRPKAFLETTPIEWMTELQINNEEAERIGKLLSRSGQLAIEIERLSSIGIWITTRAESTYPNRYKKLLRTNSPVVLYGAGDINILENRAIAIVGSRDVDQSGKEFTELVATTVVNNGYTVVSGGSRGVDSIAENAALLAKGKVISVLSDSLETTIRKKETRNQILNSNLLLLSAYNPIARFKGYTAIERNKHIYALADYTFVSSSDKKGGTWAGANENLNFAWNPLLVRNSIDVPEGNEALIKLGGIPILFDEVVGASRNLDEFIELKKNIVSPISTKPATVYNLFDTVWPVIEKYLHEDRSVNDVSIYFALYPEQARLWLEEAVKNNRIKRTTKGYKKTTPIQDHEQITLF
ncbi:DNA-processing protein DprA [Paenibacillus rhizoplanae]|uniref:DNA-processing protein DprA n=1 Tax=Paenibacillus rhizoplanae TaxID=1917181 RepID=A0ABW5FGM3_9BACL